jgi:hypothetical protein
MQIDRAPPSTHNRSSSINSGSQTFDEDWWTMLIESSTEWTLNQSYDFKVMNSLSTQDPRQRMNTVDLLSRASTVKRMRTHAFNKILVQYDAKLKWGTRWMGWCWFPSLKVYGMTFVFPLVLNHFSVEWKLFSKVCDPLLPTPINP